MSATPDLAGAWPMRTLADCTAQLCAPGALHEIAEIAICSRQVKTWKNVPLTFAELAVHASTHGARTFPVLGEDRVTYEA